MFVIDRIFYLHYLGTFAKSFFQSFNLSRIDGSLLIILGRGAEDYRGVLEEAVADAIVRMLAIGKGDKAVVLDSKRGDGYF